jgi:hypothetical protein
LLLIFVVLRSRYLGFDVVGRARALCGRRHLRLVVQTFLYQGHLQAVDTDTSKRFAGRPRHSSNCLTVLSKLVPNSR